MRILQVVSNIGKNGGIMHFLMVYFRAQPTKDMFFDFIYFDSRGDSYEQEIKSLGGRCFLFSSPKNLSKFIKEISRFSKEHYGEFDVLHLHDPFIISFFSPLKKKCGIKRVVSHAHSTRFSDTFLGNIRNTVLSLPNFFLPDAYFACSKLAGTRLFGKRFQRKGYIINNAIDLNSFTFDAESRSKIRKELRIDEKKVIGHVGNFVIPKNHAFLLKVFKELLNINSNCVLVLIGDGPLKESLISIIKELSLIHI